jgi:hypothetical protein
MADRTDFRLATVAPLFLALSACPGSNGSRPAAIAENPVSYAVPVDAGCIGRKGRPAKVQPLNQRYTPEQWAALAPAAKVAAGSAQAGARMNFEDEDAAATVGCH